MPVDPRFIITMRTKGGPKEFILFAGLLDLAHQQGLIAIETEVLTELSRPENDYWVVRSIGRFRCPEGEATWSAHGDACKDNSQMVGAYLRHAETRAIARMLRIATNVGMTAFEEVDFREQEEEKPQHRGRTAPQSAPRTAQDARQTLPPTPKANGTGEEEAPVICEAEGCGAILTVDEVKGCRVKADRFKNGMYCRDHGIAYLAAAKANAEENPDAPEPQPLNQHPIEAGEACCECGAGPLPASRIKVSQRLHSGKVVCSACEDSIPLYKSNRIGVSGMS